MKLNLKEKIKGTKGEDLDKTYGEFLSEIMFAPAQDDPPHNKYRFFKLGMKVSQKDEVEFDEEEVQFIMGKVERVSFPLFVGRIKEFLERKEKGNDESKD